MHFRWNERDIHSKCIAVIPCLSMNVMQKLLKDSCSEYISDVPGEMIRLHSKNDQK